jgi:Ca2+-binding EF-hand superfamily protein
LLLSEAEKKRRADVKQAEAHIVAAGLDTLGRAELEILMQHLTGHEPSEYVIDLLMMKAAKPTTKNGRNSVEKGRITKPAALALVARHLDYVEEQAEIDQIFDEFDGNKNGKLEPDELIWFLRKLRPESNVTDADVQFVLADCDKNGDGMLSREEVLPVCAAWQRLVDEHAMRFPWCSWCFFRCCGGKPAEIGV